MNFEDTVLQLEMKDFKEDEGTRQHLKLLLNSALGKFNQKNSQVYSKFLRTTKDFEKIFQSGEEIVEINDISDYLCQVNLKSNFRTQNRRTNPIILAFITAKARVNLHTHILNLVKRNFCPYYCDTDSILFSGPRQKNIPLQFSLAFGDFKHELGENVSIKKFEAYGRKNFAIAYERQDHDEHKILMKVCGLSLQSKIMQDEVSLLFAEKKKKPKLAQIRQIFKKKLSIGVPSVQQITFNNVDIRCERKIISTCSKLSTEPWGF